MRILTRSSTGLSSTKRTFNDLPTDSEQCCQDCGFFGHTKGRCACDLVTIEYKLEPGINSIELMEEKECWKRGKFMTYSSKHKAFIVRQFLSPGKHVFKFLINNTEWRLSPDYPTIKSSRGNNNFIIVEPVNYQSILIENKQDIGDNAKVRIFLPLQSLKIMRRDLNLLIKEDFCLKVYGSWDNWTEGKCMEYDVGFGTNPEYYYITINLPIGEYEYKFTIDDRWVVDPYRSVRENNGNLNHYFDIRNFNKKTYKSPAQMYNLSSTKLPVTEIKTRSLDLFKIYGHSMNVIDSKIYIFGGCFQTSFLGSMIVINPKTFSSDIYTVLDANAPEQLGFHKTITYGHKILMFGGHNEGSVLDRYSTFDTINHTWTTCSIRNKPQKREMFTLNHKHKSTIAYLFGGYYWTADLEYEKNFNDLYALHLDTMQFEKLDTENPPEPRCHHTAEIIDSNLYVFGGMQVRGDFKNCFNDIYSINIDDHNDLIWEKIETKGTAPCPRYGHVMMKYKRQFLIHGGVTSDKQHLNNYLWDLWIFDTISHNWTSVQIDGYSEKLGRAFHSACIHDGNIIIYGGKFRKQYAKEW